MASEDLARAGTAVDPNEPSPMEQIVGLSGEPANVLSRTSAGARARALARRAPWKKIALVAASIAPLAFAARWSRVRSLRPRRSTGRSFLGLAAAASAFGAVSFGAASIGAFAVARLAIRDARIRRLRIERLEIDDLDAQVHPATQGILP